MKKVMFLFFLFSITAFPCKMLVNPGKPFIISNNKVYYTEAGNAKMELSGADSDDFQTISYSVESCEYRDYGKDSHNVYFKNTKVELMQVLIWIVEFWKMHFSIACSPFLVTS